MAMSGFGASPHRVRAIGVALVLAVVVSAAAVSTVPGVSAAAPRANAPSPLVTSLYGGVRDVSAASASHDALVGEADFGFVSNITQINTTSSTFEQVLREVYGISLSIEYCRPNCLRPRETTIIDYNASRTITGWTNLTTNSSVVAGNLGPFISNSTAAIGVLNSHVVFSESVRESVVDRSANRTVVRALNASVSSTADSQVTFTTPGGLGLIPLQPSPGETWTSASLYNSNASWSATWSIEQSGTRGGNISESRTLGSPLYVNVTDQPVLFRGSTSGTTRFDAHDVNVISYGAITGQLVLVDGFAVAVEAPPSFYGDLGGGMWETVNAVLDHVSPTEVYTSTTGTSPVLVQSATMSFATGVRDPYNDNANDSLSNQTVTGRSMSPPTYNEYASCLSSSAATCSATSLVGPGPLGLPASVGTYLPVGAGLVVAALIAAVLVARRRQLPPPPYPNAALYPPGSTTVSSSRRASAPATPKNGGPPEPSAEDDPLSQLW